MSLDELSIDSGESWTHGTEWISEKSEKQKESAKKAQSQLQKTKKDEQKAKWDNDALFHILIHFIKNPYYEELVPVVTELLQEGYPSRYILSLVALVYPDAALYLFQAVGSPHSAMKITNLHRYIEPTVFHEDEIHQSLRDWISMWINAVEKFLNLPDRSIVLSQKFLLLITLDSPEIAILASERFFRFFFTSRNLLLPEKQALQYARFITDLIHNAAKKSLEWADIDLTRTEKLDEKDLFWIG